MYSVSTRIVDNDMKGLLGRGTVFKTEIKIGNQLQEHEHEYSLFDVLEGKFNLAEILAPLKKQAAEFAALEDARRAEERKKLLEEREADITVSQALEAAIERELVDSSVAIAQYKDGKEKALNSVVGKIIGNLKKLNEPHDAFAITTALKKRLQ